MVFFIVKIGGNSSESETSMRSPSIPTKEDTPQRDQVQMNPTKDHHPVTGVFNQTNVMFIHLVYTVSMCIVAIIINNYYLNNYFNNFLYNFS